MTWYWFNCCPTDPAFGCLCQQSLKAPPDCVRQVKTFATQQQCLDFIRQRPDCPHAEPGQGKIMGASWAAFDVGDPQSTDRRPVLLLDCSASSNLDTSVRMMARIAAADDGQPGLGQFRPVLQADVLTAPDWAAGVRYRARLMSYDAGDKCGLPVLPVYGLLPNCRTGIQCLCGTNLCGRNLPRNLCLNLAGSDTGIVPLTLVNNLNRPVGFNNTSPPCTLPQSVPQGCPFDAATADDVWTGCFQSKLGFTVYVFLIEGCNTQNCVSSCFPNQLALWFFFPCAGNQYGCGNWAWSVTCDNGTLVCPGYNQDRLGDIIQGMTATFPAVVGRCTSLPGVGWGGSVTDGNCCGADPDTGAPIKAFKPGKKWYVCQPQGGGGKYCNRGGCLACDGVLSVGPFCSLCQCQDYLAHNP